MTIVGLHTCTVCHVMCSRVVVYFGALSHNEIQVVILLDVIDIYNETG